MKGKICGVVNHGTVITVDVRGERDFFIIPWEWRMFQHFLESTCGEGAMMEDLLGLQIEYDGEQVFVLEEDEQIRASLIPTWLQEFEEEAGYITGREKEGG